MLHKTKTAAHCYSFVSFVSPRPRVHIAFSSFSFAFLFFFFCYFSLFTVKYISRLNVIYSTLFNTFGFVLFEFLHYETEEKIMVAAKKKKNSALNEMNSGFFFWFFISNIKFNHIWLCKRRTQYENQNENPKSTNEKKIGSYTDHIVMWILYIWDSIGL